MFGTRVSRVASSRLGAVILRAEVGEGQLLQASIDLDRWGPRRAIRRRDVLSLRKLPLR